MRLAKEMNGAAPGVMVVSTTGGVQAVPGLTTTTQARGSIPLPRSSTVPGGSTGAPPLTSCTCSVTGVTGSRICTVPPTIGKPPGAAGVERVHRRLPAVLDDADRAGGVLVAVEVRGDLVEAGDQALVGVRAGDGAESAGRGDDREGGPGQLPGRARRGSDQASPRGDRHRRQGDRGAVRVPLERLQRDPPELLQGDRAGVRAWLQHQSGRARRPRAPHLRRLLADRDGGESAGSNGQLVAGVEGGQRRQGDGGRRSGPPSPGTGRSCSRSA